MSYRLVSNPTGSIRLVPADAGKTIIVKNTTTGQVGVAAADQIIKNHAHTNTWQAKRHWNCNIAAPEFKTV